MKEYAFEKGRFVAGGPTPWIATGRVLAKNCGEDPLCVDSMPGGMLSFSANGTLHGTGIVWALLRGQGPSGNDMIYAFDADTLTELWSDQIGAVPHFAEATVADGKVFVPTNTQDHKLYIFRLGSAPVSAVHATGRLAWRWPARAAMTMNAMRSNPIPDYAMDPMFRARPLMPELQPPAGMIARASYAVAGVEVYACRAQARPPRCTSKATRIRQLYDYDDRTSTASVAASATVPANASHTIDVSRPTTLKASFPGSAEWQRLDHPGGVFGSAAYVLRTKTVGGAPPSAPAHDGEVTVPFRALYTSFDVPPAKRP